MPVVSRHGAAERAEGARDGETAMQRSNELAERIRQAHERFQQAVAGVPDDVLEREPATGTWSARDVAGNLADWANELIIAVECCLGTRPKPDYFPITDNQQYNDDHAAL